MSYFLHLYYFLTIIILLIYPGSALAQNDCNAPEFTADQIHEIIKNERANRDDLPRAYPKYKYEVIKEGCYYQYWEEKQPDALHASRRFTLNKFGAIVEILRGPAVMFEFKCPEKVYSESELAEIIKRERELRQDLPQPFSNYKVQTARYGCLYLYFESELPEGSKNYLVFTIDPFGELMEFRNRKLINQ